ncbi:hypothetical protein [Euzebya rosea]|uniref:hypothetical protein n=1 Tax=Euzebya rosea TaxID=2052804 RepID=UPI0013003095|nr:hypothetical protein [Euzebya rosea]
MAATPASETSSRRDGRGWVGLPRPGLLDLGLAASVAGLAAGLYGTLAHARWGLSVLCLGTCGLVVLLARRDREYEVSQLPDVTLGEVAEPLPRLSRQSTHPRHDLALLSPIVPAIVRTDDGWGVVSMDVAVAALARPDFHGTWADVAQPLALLPGSTRLQALRRVPRDHEVLLVEPPSGGPPLGVTGVRLRNLGPQPVRRRHRARLVDLTRAPSDPGSPTTTTPPSTRPKVGA